MVIAGVRSNFDHSFPFANRADWYGYSDTTKQTTKQPEPVAVVHDWPLATGSQTCETYQQRLQRDLEDKLRKKAEAEENAAFNAQMLFRRVTWGR
jgi:hypothetical protein